MRIKDIFFSLSILFVFGLVCIPFSVSAVSCDPAAASALGSFQGCEANSFDFQYQCDAVGGVSTITNSQFVTNSNYYMCYGDPVLTMECICPQASPAPTLTFTATDPDVLWGTETSLNWASTDATSCTASGDWSGPMLTSGSYLTGSIWSTKTYILDCTGPGGTVSQSVTVNWHVFSQTVTDQVPVGVLDGASCSAVSGWTYDPDTTPTNSTTTTTPPPTTTSSTACWQTPSAAIIDGYHRCQQSGSCTTVGATANSKCLDQNGNMEQPPGQDYCVAVPSLDDVDCNRSVPYPATLSCTVGINEPANALGISIHQGEGTRVLGQQPSADFACQQLGYNSAVYFQTRGFSSCGNNQLAYANAGAWAYGDACALGNSGISYVQCSGTGNICQNKCGNGVIDPGEQCDSSSSTTDNRCGEPSWYCSNTCRIISNTISNITQCP